MRVKHKSIIVTGSGGSCRRPDQPGLFPGQQLLGRFSTALDAANAVLHLASDEAGFISGVCLEVDGARCA